MSRILPYLHLVALYVSFHLLAVKRFPTAIETGSCCSSRIQHTQSWLQVLSSLFLLFCFFLSTWVSTETKKKVCSLDIFRPFRQIPRILHFNVLTLAPPLLPQLSIRLDIFPPIPSLLPAPSSPGNPFVPSPSKEKWPTRKQNYNTHLQINGMVHTKLTDCNIVPFYCHSCVLCCTCPNVLIFISIKYHLNKTEAHWADRWSQTCGDALKICLNISDSACYS